MGKFLNPNLIDVERLECCTCVCGNNWSVVYCMIFASCSFILDLLSSEQILILLYLDLEMNGFFTGDLLETADVNH